MTGVQTCALPICPDHDKSFSATALVGGAALASGEGKSKRDAEQAAARAAYIKLNA